MAKTSQGFAYLLLVIIISIIGIGLISFFAYKNRQIKLNLLSQASPTLNPTTSTFKLLISEEEAEKIVKDQPEVKEQLVKYPMYLVDAEGYDKKNKRWNVHVYEIVDNHTATFDWYYVDVESGAVTRESQI